MPCRHVHVHHRCDVLHHVFSWVVLPRRINVAVAADLCRRCWSRMQRWHTVRQRYTVCQWSIRQQHAVRVSAVPRRLLLCGWCVHCVPRRPVLHLLRDGMQRVRRRLLRQRPCADDGVVCRTVPRWRILSWRHGRAVAVCWRHVEQRRCRVLLCLPGWPVRRRRRCYGVHPVPRGYGRERHGADDVRVQWVVPHWLLLPAGNVSASGMPRRHVHSVTWCVQLCALPCWHVRQWRFTVQPAVSCRVLLPKRIGAAVPDRHVRHEHGAVDGVVYRPVSRWHLQHCRWPVHVIVQWAVSRGVLLPWRLKRPSPLPEWKLQRRRRVVVHGVPRGSGQFLSWSHDGDVQWPVPRRLRVHWRDGDAVGLRRGTVQHAWVSDVLAVSSRAVLVVKRVAGVFAV